MPHPLRSLRYRRCPQCQTVLRASEFPRATTPTTSSAQLQNRRCPECGHTGPLMSFQVAEWLAVTDEGTPS